MIRVMDPLDLFRPLDGADRPLFVIAGPCVIEDPERGDGYTLGIARRLAAILDSRSIPWIFKASFDKANRTSLNSYRGPGLERGLDVLDSVKREIGVPVLTDVHETAQVTAAAEVADVIQIPAFLCRQTDLLVAAATRGRAVNVKKGQFLAPEDMAPALEKIRAAGGTDRVALTERGTSFGYRNLVVDMTSFPALRELGAPVVFDATHAVQRPGGLGTASGGRREMIPTLAAAAIAAGIDGLFLEVHPEPDRGLSDGPNMLVLDELPRLIDRMIRLRDAR
jgi:2-dehydro-3-deoxyphosphooctonate aldolase (KDO 8-P synthase)